MHMSLTKLGSSIVMHQYGGPEVLKVERAPLTALEPGEIRIQAIASAINHSDLEIRSGNWPILKPDPFPYTPGLEVVGDVVEVGVGVQNLHSGDRVIAMMQGLGGVHARRPGGYAEYVTVRANTVAALDGDLAPLDMAAVGLAGVTAFEGLRKLGTFKDRRIAITGAAGGVGSAAVALARAEGAEVIAVISRFEHAQ